MCRSLAIVACLLLLHSAPGDASAQNDWQFPDPYFGILEVEKSHADGSESRHRGQAEAASKPEQRSKRQGVQRNRFRQRARLRSVEGTSSSSR